MSDIIVTETLSQTVEQQARELLESMGVEHSAVQDLSAGDIVPLANLINENERLRGLLREGLEEDKDGEQWDEYWARVRQELDDDPVRHV